MLSYTATCCHAKETSILAFGTNKGEADVTVELCGVAYFLSLPQHLRIGAGTLHPPFSSPSRSEEQLQWHRALLAGLKWMPTHSELEGLSGNWQYPELGVEDCIWKKLIQEAAVTYCWATRKVIFHNAEKLDTVGSRPLVTLPESRIQLFNHPV